MKVQLQRYYSFVSLLLLDTLFNDTAPITETCKIQSSAAAAAAAAATTTTTVAATAVAQLVEELRYKPEGRGFDSRWCHWNFSLA
jgi:hypothetical protein